MHHLAVELNLICHLLLFLLTVEEIDLLAQTEEGVLYQLDLVRGQLPVGMRIIVFGHLLRLISRLQRIALLQHIFESLNNSNYKYIKCL